MTEDLALSWPVKRKKINITDDDGNKIGEYVWTQEA